MTDSSTVRHGIYFSPPRAHPLRQKAACWLGRCAKTGEPKPRPVSLAVDAADIARLTMTPARYGFHATFKAPFTLAAPYEVEALDVAIEALTQRSRPIILTDLEIGWVGGVLAIVARKESALLNEFVFQTVCELDDFRAPLGESERQRRHALGLNARQSALLDTYGYPYVGEEFRFHMTLTGNLSAEPAPARIEAAARQWFDAELKAPLVIDSLSRFTQPASDLPFVEQRRFSFAQSARPSAADPAEQRV